MKYASEYITINNKEVRQVNRVTAEKLYNQGKTIYLNACNMRLNNAWTSPMPLDNGAGEKFSTMLNEYTYYNCCNERGKYANFFTEV